MAQGTLLTAFLAETVLITYRQYAGGGVQVPTSAPVPLPIPASYTAPIIAYGALALIPGEGARLAGMIGWGLVVATLLNLWNPSGSVKQQTTVPGGPAPGQPAKQIPAGQGGDFTRSQAPNFIGPLPSN